MSEEQDTGTAQAAREAQEEADRAFLERIYGVHPTGWIETFSSSWHFTPRDHARAVRIATVHHAVTPFLQGRWSVLGADQVWQPAGFSDRQTVHVRIFNYTANRLIDVRIENDKVASVDERGIHEYPESPQEMATAIDLARSHPDLRDEVRDLEGHAILSVSPDPRDPSVLLRGMWVMFTDHDDPTRELPTQYAAFVDLGAMEVVASGPTPAPAQVDDPRTEAK